MRKPLILTRAPLILAGEASEMYRGAVTDAIPIPNPTKTLPRMMTDGTGAAAITKAPIKNITSATKIDLFLPTLSFIHPPNAAPIIDPATAILTMVSCTTMDK